jgi:D-alanine-D-alanine ligase
MRTIAIIAGGNSSEYVVSVKSAAAVAEVLKNRYKTYIVMIRESNWYWEDSKGRAYPIDKNDFSLIVDDKKVRFDAAFIAIHGTPGEDGLLQGYFDMLRIPYTSCGALSSALTFSKQACKAYLHQFGIDMAEAVLIRKGQNFDRSEIIAKTGLPCFVKPDDSGSSFGVSKVKELSKLDAAIEVAFRESNTVLIEAEMKGREVACGIVKTAGREIVFPVTEIISKNEFFDFEAKYTPGMSQEITPAEMPDQTIEQIQTLTSRIYDYLGCRGIVRVDFIVEDGKPRFLEINTIPGMTAESLIPQQATAYGISHEELYSMVIEDIFK